MLKIGPKCRRCNTDDFRIRKGVCMKCKKAGLRCMGKSVNGDICGTYVLTPIIDDGIPLCYMHGKMSHGCEFSNRQATWEHVHKVMYTYKEQQHKGQCCRDNNIYFNRHCQKCNNDLTTLNMKRRT